MEMHFLRAIFALILLETAPMVRGVKCWTCENAVSVEDCNARGKLEHCNGAQNTCGIEVRANGGWRLEYDLKIHKFCKQERACENVQNQNAKNAWNLSQCNPKFPNSVCRCCCRTDKCNAEKLECKREPVSIPDVCSPSFSSLQFGKVLCTDGNKVGSECRFRCDTGYYIIGHDVSVCQINGKWSCLLPVCQSVACQALPDIAQGFYVCTNDNLLGSVCRYSCDSGYRLVGPEAAICEEDGKSFKVGLWSASGQLCERKFCEGPLEPVAHGSVACSDGTYLGSVCSFSCDEGFEIQGSVSSSCVELKSGQTVSWDSLPPECLKASPDICQPPLAAPENGEITCTTKDVVGSDCSFVCDRGFYLVGHGSSTCQGNGEWSTVVPSCGIVVCPDLPTIDHGTFQCSRGTQFGSDCRFSCDTDYIPLGFLTATCVQDDNDASVGLWSTSGQLCKRKECDSIPLTPLNGATSCSDNAFIKSECTFTCEDGYERIGSAATTCVETNGQLLWTVDPPACEPSKECSSNLRIPTNGQMQCSEGKNFGSICEFSCGALYKVVGSIVSTCREVDGLVRWSDRSPKCQKKECWTLPKVPEKGSMLCSDDHFVGSVCAFTCDEDYERVGASNTMCDFVDGKSSKNLVWDRESPQCIRKKCVNGPPSLVKGFVSCIDGNYVGSECEYWCEDFHRRVGALYTTCVESDNGLMKWTEAVAPICERITCSDLKRTKFENIECTDQQFVNSECTFECALEDYILYPSDKPSITCLNDTTWTARQPCCTRSCPPFAVMDFIVVLDSSSSIGEQSWQVMLDFVNHIFDLFVFRPDAMHFGVVRYNKEVDTDTVLNLNEFSDTVETLKNVVSNMPYNGAGTWTGQAIRYVRENMLKEENGDRPEVPNIVLVITDGRSQDDVSAPAQAMRDDGALTFALGITPTNGKLDREQLLDIAGSESKLFLAKDGFDTLTPEFASEITDNICGDPCERVPF